MWGDKVPLSGHWKEKLGDEFTKPYMVNLREYLKSQLAQGKVVYPPKDNVFEALKLTPFEDVKVVIIGQDPYHGPGQAHGLCFSVRPGVPIPPSLVNIFKEMKNDLNISQPGHGYLEAWARQGVLLLNAVLTVEAGHAASHQNKGWETFTDRVIEVLNREKDGLVFVLWGSYAQKKGAFIDRQRHLVLEAPHPSPLSAHRGFLGSRHFSHINAYLNQRGVGQIEWALPPLH